MQTAEEKIKEFADQVTYARIDEASQFTKDFADKANRQPTPNTILPNGDDRVEKFKRLKAKLDMIKVECFNENIPLNLLDRTLDFYKPAHVIRKLFCLHQIVVLDTLEYYREGKVIGKEIVTLCTLCGKIKVVKLGDTR